MRIIMLRHPQTVANEKGIIYGHSDYPYTEKGIRQSSWALEQSKLFGFDRIVTSPAERAARLAETIGKSHKKMVCYDDDLKEMGFGIFEGKTAEEAKIHHPEAYDDFMNRFLETTVPEGESYEGFYRRTRRVLGLIIDHGKDTLVVTHGGVMMEWISRLLNLEPGACWNYHFGNCSFAEFNIEEDRTRLLNLVNCDHI